MHQKLISIRLKAQLIFNCKDDVINSFTSLLPHHIVGKNNNKMLLTLETVAQLAEFDVKYPKQFLVDVSFLSAFSVDDGMRRKVSSILAFVPAKDSKFFFIFQITSNPKIKMKTQGYFSYCICKETMKNVVSFL